MTWTMRSNAIDKETLGIEESLFFNGNGYIGVRGNFEEGTNQSYQTIRGTYINGFYEDVTIPYGEKQYGFPDTQQKLVNNIDAQTIEIWVGKDAKKELVSLWTGEIIKYERKLHVDKGISERTIHWKSTEGYELIVNFKRLVSFTTKELIHQFITLTPISENIPITIRSTVNGNVENYSNSNDPRVASGDSKHLQVIEVDKINQMSFVEVETKNSKLQSAALSILSTSEEKATFSYDVQEQSIETTIHFTLNGETTVEKRTLMADTIRYENLKRDLLTIHEQIHSLSFMDLCQKQKNYLDNFWKQTDVTIDGDEELQEGLRFNLYHILQSTGQDGITSISAKGLSGEGYEGHYFWDTEIYLIPIFTLTNPELAKKLLLFRYSILDDARARARIMGHNQGALFPWRTISGTECSSYFPAGSAQYHISADIAYSYIQYYLATKDEIFLKEFGAEVLIETARLWLDTGHFHHNQFKIDTVTGPDEYTCIVNNNYYTNAMAKYNLYWAHAVANILQEEEPEAWQILKDKILITDEELLLFKQAADNMYLPIDKMLNINPQDDTFLQKEKWDFENTPKDHYPLLLHYHPLTIYRYQVCKQADTILAHFLLEDEQSEEVMKNSYQYYESVTTHDSSLSSCVFSMMAARLDQIEKAYDYFIETARLDLDNLQGNTKDGLHMANMGGTWMAIVKGFAGTRIKENGLYFRPHLPKQWKGYTFTLQYQGRLLEVSINQDQFTVQLVRGDQLSIYIWNHRVILLKDQPVQLPLGFLKEYERN